MENDDNSRPIDEVSQDSGSSRDRAPEPPADLRGAQLSAPSSLNDASREEDSQSEEESASAAQLSEDETLDRWSFSQVLSHKEMNLIHGTPPPNVPIPAASVSSASTMPPPSSSAVPSSPSAPAISFDKEAVRLAGAELKTWADKAECYSCQSRFSFMNRQHHCRKCGRAFCGTCASKSAKIPESETLPQLPKTRYFQTMEFIKTKIYVEKRVCDSCFAYLEEERATSHALQVLTLIKCFGISELFRLGGVCKAWWRATLSLLKDFRLTQYSLPTESLKPVASESLWVNRDLLPGHPSYLVKLLLTVDWQKEPEKVAEVLNLCRRPRVVRCKKLMCSRYCVESFQLSHALELLISDIENAEILAIVVKTLETISSDELLCVLPVLVSSLENNMRRRRDRSFSNPVLDFLERKAKASDVVLIEYFWLIKVNFNVLGPDKKSYPMREFLFNRLQPLIGGQRMRDVLRGERLVNALETVAASTEEPQKLKLKLSEELRSANPFETASPFLVPVNAVIKAKALDMDKISIKDSANKPMLLTFKLAEEHLGLTESKMLFKKEDLRKDQIVVNLIRLMDITLRREGMDLDIVTYRVLPASEDSGLIDIVLDSETVHKIELSHHRSIQNWILYHNRDKVIDKVRMRYIRSLAAYCAMTYLLGIGDRHLENIMITKDGALFHIDFGFVLGQDPKVMAPQIRVTPGMLDAIGGLRSEYYQEFDRTLKRAFNVLRRRVSLFSSLLLLLSDVFKRSGAAAAPFTRDQMMEQINFRFMVGQGEEEAALAFDAFILASSNSWGALLIDVTHNNRDTPLSVVQAVKGLKKGWFGY